MPANTYKIYYATLHLASDKSVDVAVAREITVIFDIPFYRSSGDNSGMPNTWLPFLGMQPYNNQAIIEKSLLYGVIAKVQTGAPRGWFRKPDDVGIKNLTPFSEEAKKEFPLPGNNAYGRFATIKCLLISAALGGGVWDTPDGKNLLEFLKKPFSQFFENYKLILTDSNRHINHLQQGISENSSRRITWMVEVNKLLEGKSGHDLSFNFKVDDWNTIFNDIDVLLMPNNPPLSLNLWERKIDDYFSIKLATAIPKTLLDKYTFFVPDALALQELSLTSDEFMAVIRTIDADRPRWGTLRSMRCTIVDTKKIVTILFLDTGHIVLHPEPNYKRLSSEVNATVFKAYCVTLGCFVAIKVKSDTKAYLNPGIIAKENSQGIVPIIGTCVLNPQPNTFVTLMVLGFYPYSLTDVINSNRLSLPAIEKIFKTLLIGLRNIHKTSIEFEPHIKAKAFHSDIKPDNILIKLIDKELKEIPINSLQADQFEVCIADLDLIGRFDNIFYTQGFVSPEIALASLALDAGVKGVVIENNVAFGRAYDIWAMGLTLAKVLEVNNNPSGIFLSSPNLIFIMACQNMNQTYLHQVAGLKQSTIDKELNAIKESLPKNPEGKKLRALWNVVHSMLQVAPDQRPNIFTVINNFRSQMNRKDEVIFRQRTIPEYFLTPKQEKRQRTLEEYFVKLQLNG